MSKREQIRFGSIRFRVGGDDLVAWQLLKFIDEVVRATTIPEVAARIARGFVDHLGARRVRVYISSADGRALQLMATEDVDAVTDARLATSRIVDDLAAATVAHLGLPQVMNVNGTFALGQAEDADDADRVGCRIILALPLFASMTIAGAVSASFDRPFVEDHALFDMLSYSFGAAVDRARLRDQVTVFEASVRMPNEAAATAIAPAHTPRPRAAAIYRPMRRPSGGPSPAILGLRERPSLLASRRAADLASGAAAPRAWGSGHARRTSCKGTGPRRLWR